MMKMFFAAAILEIYGIDYNTMFILPPMIEKLRTMVSLLNVLKKPCLPVPRGGIRLTPTVRW
ncbi:MAG: hypothetical protein ACKPKO_54000, partial [Candidatus Fonsibacter sp.]